MLALQLYLGTARVQLEGKGDTERTYMRVLSFIVPGIVVLTPVNGLLLDRLGYGIVLLVINSLNLASIVGQMLSSLQAQVRVSSGLWRYVSVHTSRLHMNGTVALRSVKCCCGAGGAAFDTCHRELAKRTSLP